MISLGLILSNMFSFSLFFLDIYSVYEMAPSLLHLIAVVCFQLQCFQISASH
uniref:Uncharacterized protein n=1 Tax=Arundo donax TaxID=35708 RepID=A0A0A9BYR4_ARUDO